MVLPKKLFSLLTAQSLVKSEKSEETSVIRDFHSVLLLRCTWRSRFAGHVISFCVFLFGAGLDRFFTRLSSCLFWRWGGGGGCLHITVLVHFVNSAGLSRIYNNTSASGSASALRASAQGLRALRVVYT